MKTIEIQNNKNRKQKYYINLTEIQRLICTVKMYFFREKENENKSKNNNYYYY